MAYIPAADSEHVDVGVVVAIARLAGLDLPPEDLVPLATALTGQLAAIQALDSLDLTGVSPILEFDPRWSSTENRPFETNVGSTA